MLPVSLSWSRMGKKFYCLKPNELGLVLPPWSGGVVRVAHQDVESVRQAAISRKYYLELSSGCSGKVPFYQTGHLSFGSEETLNECCAVLKENELSASLLTSSELQTVCPDLDVDAECGLFEPESGFMDPVVTVKALACKGLSGGGEIREGVFARNLLYQDTEVIGVDIGYQQIFAEVVICAAGSHNNSLLATGLFFNKDVQVSLFVKKKRLKTAPTFNDFELGINGRFCPETGGLFVGLPIEGAPDIKVGPSPLDYDHVERTKEVASERFGWLKDSKFAGGLCHTDSYSKFPMD